jgi:transcriptional regulator with XRE-family HTH domain
MRRTELLQEIRTMRLEEADEGWQARRLTQEEAARLLGVCERTFRRYLSGKGLPWPNSEERTRDASSRYLRRQLRSFGSGSLLA